MAKIVKDLKIPINLNIKKWEPRQKRADRELCEERKEQNIEAGRR